MCLLHLHTCLTIPCSLPATTALTFKHCYYTSFLPTTSMADSQSYFYAILFSILILYLYTPPCHALWFSTTPACLFTFCLPPPALLHFLFLPPPTHACSWRDLILRACTLFGLIPFQWCLLPPFLHSINLPMCSWMGLLTLLQF